MYFVKAQTVNAVEALTQDNSTTSCAQPGDAQIGAYNQEMHKSGAYNQEMHKSGAYNQEIHKSGAYNQKMHKSGAYNQEMHKSGAYNQEMHKCGAYNLKMHKTDAYELRISAETVDKAVHMLGKNACLRFETIEQRA